MRTRLIVTVIALVVCAQATSVSGRLSATRRAFSMDAFEPGAVYELSLRVPWADVEQYLSLYAKWFLHVDMAPHSGRKLLTVLSREVGSDRNLVFLYWYESAYKEQYYCNYAREFFTYHLKNEATRSELRSLYDDASTVFGVPPRDDAGILADLRECTGNNVPVAVGEAIRKVDGQLRRLVVADEDSWNFGVNPCRVQRISGAEREKTRIPELESCEKSLLETAVRSSMATGRESAERK